MSLATVDPVHPHAAWSAKGAAGDALQRAPHEKPFLAVWLDDDGAVRWSKANTDFGSLSMFAVFVFELAQCCVREALK